MRIQSPEEYPLAFTSTGYQQLYYDNSIKDSSLRAQNDYKNSIKEDASQYIQEDFLSIKSSLEKMLKEKIKIQKQNIREIGERLISLETGHENFNNFKEETNSMLISIEKKCFDDIKKIKNNGKEFITQEDLKIGIESLKKSNITQLKQIEGEIQNIYSENINIKEEVFRIAEEKIRETSKKYVSQQEFEGVKENILRELNQKIKDIEFNLYDRLENIKIDDERRYMKFEQKIQEISKKYEKQEENIYKKTQELEKSLENINYMHLNSIKSLNAKITDISELVNTKVIDSEMESLKKQVALLPRKASEPDLTDYAKKIDIQLLEDKIQELMKYKEIFDLKITEIETKVNTLETQLSESEEIDIDLAPNQSFARESGETEVKKENTDLTKISLNNLGDSDTHGYVTPCISPMNQMSFGSIKSIDKNTEKRDFKKKTDLHIKNPELIMINEDHCSENNLSNTKQAKEININALIQLKSEEKNKKELKKNESIKISNKNISYKSEIEIPIISKDKISTGMLKENLNLNNSTRDKDNITMNLGKTLDNAVKIPLTIQEKEKLSATKELENTLPKRINIMDLDMIDLDTVLTSINSKPLESKNIKNTENIPSNALELANSDIKKLTPSNIQKIEFKPIVAKCEKIEKSSNINAFIQEIVESFIDNEINNGCKAISIRGKPELSSLKIPQNIKNMGYKHKLNSSSIASSDILDSDSEEITNFSGEIHLP